MTLMLANDWATSTLPFTTLVPNGNLLKSSAMALVVTPALSLRSGICWFKVMVKPATLKITSFGVGLTGMVTDVPKTVIAKFESVVDPVAEGIPLTEDVELINVELRLKIESNETERLLMVDVADPIAVPVSPLAVSVSAPVVRLIGPKLVLKEGSELVTS
jgi:hypothetical protein